MFLAEQISTFQKCNIDSCWVFNWELVIFLKFFEKVTFKTQLRYLIKNKDPLFVIKTRTSLRNLVYFWGSYTILSLRDFFANNFFTHCIPIRGYVTIYCRSSSNETPA